ncbi:GGDEF domain-containing protein [Cellvibrio zantedeschiae]|nr:GGDEF domain-containing protein [Cellvibrio zantedeschiae]
MTMLTGTQARPLGYSAPLTPEQEIEARAKLIQALQMSLDPNDVLAIFFKHLQAIIPMGGIQFRFPNNKDITKLGRDALHHCDYRLTTDEGYLGEIIFNRSKRFIESELTTLEILLGALVYPMRNALRHQAAMQLALLDPLTRLGNRAALDNALRRELQLAERHHHELSLLMIDVDHFKKINDQYGHTLGDQVLQEIARTIESVCRETDISFRYGGEEFVVLLRKTNEMGARTIGERLRREISTISIEKNGQSIEPTVSVGISTRASGQKEHISDLFERADEALYRAKQAGRNCVRDLSDVVTA